MRPAPFLTSSFYHIYNRGVDKRVVFQRYGHYLRFLTTIRTILKTGSATQRSTYNQSLALNLKVRILAYCLMPNHYHFLIQQLQDDGISEYMHKLDTSYTKYFNLNYHRTGRLFEYTFKARVIESDELLLHISRYIHINPVIAHLVEQPQEWKWSSYREFFDIESHPVCETRQILSSFQSADEYKKFVHDQIAYAMLLKEAAMKKDEDTLFL